MRSLTNGLEFYLRSRNCGSLTPAMEKTDHYALDRNVSFHHRKEPRLVSQTAYIPDPNDTLGGLGHPEMVAKGR